MKSDLGAGPGRNRHLVAMVALVGGALAMAACGGGGGGGSGGSGAGGKAAGGATGTGGKAAGGATGTGGAGTGGAGGQRTDGGPDSAVCNPDGGDDCCPDDPDKTQPGVCGCGMPDTDTDTDGTPDCIDLCPTDRNKIAPGTCGCNGVETDSDGDGTPDCNDMCPHDKTRLVPGVCGCGAPDTTAPLCLTHRYRFDAVPGTDGGASDGGASASDGGADASDGGADASDGGGAMSIVKDSVGTADGTTVNVSLPGDGTLTLAGGTSDQYVKLPSGIISGLGDNVTFEAWISWAGGAVWQRVFDFGTSDNAAGNGQGTGTSFIFFTPANGFTPSTSFLSVNTVGLTEVPGPGPFPVGLNAGRPHQVVCVVDTKGGDAGTGSASVYIDGVFVQAKQPLTSVVSGLVDLNNWLGRSQFMNDSEFSGTYYDFRIYSAALTADQVTASFNAGPDAP